MIDIVEVQQKDIKSFIDFPHQLYAGDPYYVPELFMAQKEMFDKKKYPFFEYGETYPLLAKKDNKIVGRICAIVNTRYNEYHKSNVGFFGFFDCINDQEVANRLFEAATEKLKPYKYDKLLGPTNYSTNETAGTLIDGFEMSPQIMMTYNAQYYPDLIENFGFSKEMDLYAYMIYTQKVNNKAVRLSKLFEERLKKEGITIRNVNFKQFEKEVAILKEVYNKAWENNWGFVPFTDKEFNHLADGLKMMVNADFAYIAEHNGKPVGFSVTLPNVNEITKDFRKGRLFPFNIVKLLMRKNKTKTVRIAATGIIEDYRKKGIGAIFFAKNIQEARKRNLLGGEASWILESNKEMVQAAEKLNGEKYKTYRIYSKAINC